jgi:ankyrin repeat protein
LGEIGGKENENPAQEGAVSSEQHPPVEETSSAPPSLAKPIDAGDDHGRTPLHDAIIADNANVARALLRCGSNPRIKDSMGRNAFHHVAVSNQIGDKTQVEDSLISTILEAMGLPEINELDKSGRTPLHAAMSAGNDSTSLFLLSRGATPGTMDGDGSTPLTSACELGHCAKAIGYLVKHSGEDIVNQEDRRFGESPMYMYWACKNGHRAIIEVLLAADSVDPNRPATTWGKDTPLHAALFWGNIDVVKLMLDSHRVDPSWDLADNTGCRPLEYALCHATEACTTAVLSHPRVTTSALARTLTALSERGRLTTDIFERVLKTIPDTDLPNPELDDLIRRVPNFDTNLAIFKAWKRMVGDPIRWKEVRHPLHILALQGDVDTIMGLLDMGANIFDPDEDNWTCIDVAEKSGHVELKDSLVKRIPEPAPPKQPYSVPSAFANPFDDTNVTLSDCSQSSGVGRSWAMGNSLASFARCYGRCS